MRNDDLKNIVKDLKSLQEKYNKTQKFCEAEISYENHMDLLQDLTLYVISLSHFIFNIEETE